jgi:hypothetical protein
MSEVILRGSGRSVTFSEGWAPNNIRDLPLAVPLEVRSYDWSVE